MEEEKGEKKERGGMNAIVFSDSGATQRTGVGCAEDACLCALDILILLFNV